MDLKRDIPPSRISRVNRWKNIYAISAIRISFNAITRRAHAHRTRYASILLSALEAEQLVAVHEITHVATQPRIYTWLRALRARLGGQDKEKSS